MKGLQTGNRLFLVTKFTLVKGPGRGSYSLSVDGFAYTVVNTFGRSATGVGTPVDADHGDRELSAASHHAG